MDFPEMPRQYLETRSVADHDPWGSGTDAWAGVLQIVGNYQVPSA